jgi:hypothetical protein
MIIKADQQGVQVLHQLADVVLKSGGIQNLQAINEFLSKIELIPEEKQEEVFDNVKSKQV